MTTKQKKNQGHKRNAGKPGKSDTGEMYLIEPSVGGEWESCKRASRRRKRLKKQFENNCASRFAQLEARKANEPLIDLGSPENQQHKTAPRFNGKAKMGKIVETKNAGRRAFNRQGNR